MRTSSIAILAAAAAVVVATGATLYARHEGQSALARAVAAFRAGLPPGASFTYAGSAVHPLSQSVELTAVALREPSGALLTASRLTIGGAGQRISSLHATGLRLAGAGAGISVSTASALDATDIAVPIPPPGRPAPFDPATLTFATMTLHDFAFRTAGVSVIAASAEIGHYGFGRASSLDLRTVSVPLAGAGRIDRAGFARLTGTGFDLAALLGALEHHVALPPSAPQYRLELDQGYLASGQDAVASIGSFTVTSAAVRTGAVGLGTTALTGFAFRPTDAADRARLQAIGLERISGNAFSRATYTVAGGLMDIAPATIEVDGIGTLETNLALAHVDVAGLARAGNAPAALLAAAGDAQLATLRMRFADAGLLDRAFALGARQTGSSPAGVRAMAVARVEDDPSLASLPGGDADRRAFSAFIASGGTLDVAIHPTAPVTLASLAETLHDDPATVIGGLGLTVSQGRDAIPMPH